MEDPLHTSVLGWKGHLDERSSVRPKARMASMVSWKASSYKSDFTEELPMAMDNPPIYR